MVEPSSGGKGDPYQNLRRDLAHSLASSQSHTYRTTIDNGTHRS